MLDGKVQDNAHGQTPGAPHSWQPSFDPGGSLALIYLWTLALLLGAPAPRAHSLPWR